VAVIAALSGCSGREGTSVIWSYAVRAEEGNTVVDMGPVTLVFQGRKCTGFPHGSILAHHRAAPRRKKGCRMMVIHDSSGSEGTPMPEVTFEAGYARIGIFDHEIRVLNEGESISVDGKTFSVAGPKKTITVPSSGEPFVSACEEPEPEPPAPTSRLERALADAGRGRHVKPSAALRFAKRDVPELLEILSDTRKVLWWENAVLILGYIGDERAYEPLAELVTTRFAGKTIDRHIDRAILSVPRALGLLAQRSDKALAFLEKGFSARVWEEHVTWQGALSREGVVVSLAGSCMMGVGLSGRKDHAWVMETARNREKALEHSWSSILEADRFLWWQEKYGRRRFRREWRSKRGIDRLEEYWQSERAAELKAVVTPEGITLPRTFKGLQADR